MTILSENQEVIEEAPLLDPFPVYCFRDDVKWAWGHFHRGDKFSPDEEFSQNIQDYAGVQAGSIAQPMLFDPINYLNG